MAGSSVAHALQEPSRYVLSGSVLTHPARGAAASRVLAQAPPGALAVVTDPDPAGPPTVVRTALAAWESIPASATHHLIVQDDMALSATLFDRARRAIEATPEAALALFTLWDSRNGAAVRLGALSGARWVGAVNEYTPCAALILPRAVAAGYVDYVRRHPPAWPEDILMQRYLRSADVACLLSVPNLAEHEDIPSIVGNAFRGPRRSACFLRSDRPGRENRRLTGLAAVPFYKNGVAQCVVRIPGTTPPRWLHLETSDYLTGLGVASRHLRPRLVPPISGVGPAVVNGTWLTAYALGMTTRNPTGDPDPEVVAEALRTIAAGGISHNSPQSRISDVVGPLAEVAELGVSAGRGTVPRPHRVRSGIIVLGGNGPLGEHLVRALTDRGHPVTVLSIDPPDDAQPGVRYAITGTPLVGHRRNAVIDLRQLEPSQATAAQRTVLVAPRGPGRDVLHLDTGHLYGPGCAPDSVIGAMVWAALQSTPILISDDDPDLVRPRHVRDLADLVCATLGTTGDQPGPVAEYPIGELAQIIAQVVRPVPVHDHRTRLRAAPPRTESGRPDGDLRYRLHHFAQWLAYECDRADPATST